MWRLASSLLAPEELSQGASKLLATPLRRKPSTQALITRADRLRKDRISLNLSFVRKQREITRCRAPLPESTLDSSDTLAVIH